MDLNALRGRGKGSRISVSKDDLPEGWKFKRLSSKYCIWTDPNGRRYRSSLDVKAALREQGIQSASEVDTELETASEYQPSPPKKPRSTTRWGITVLFLLTVTMR